MAKEKSNEKSNWGFIIGLVVALFVLSFIFVGVIMLFVVGTADIEDPSANTALIPVKGIILADPADGFFGEKIASSSDIVEQIARADRNPKIKAIIFEINSGGGSAVASDEIADAIKKTNKTTVAWIREAGASGGYWIASAAEHIVANRMSVTGSIGVIASYLQFSGILKEWNITYERVVSGKYKDMGSPYKELTAQERNMLQKKLDLIHGYFIDEVKANRGLKSVKEIGNGEILLGAEAYELGLVDELGGKDEVVGYIEEKLGIEVKLVTYEKKKGFFELLSGVFSRQFYFFGKGIGSEVKVWA